VWSLFPRVIWWRSGFEASICESTAVRISARQISTAPWVGNSRFPVGLIDVAKGAIPVLLLGPRLPGVTLFPTLCGVMAVVGHVYSVFVGFKGGKGVATAAGMLLGLAPEALGVALIVWLVLVRSTGYVSLGSVAAAAVFPPADYLLNPGRRTLTALGLDVAVALFVIWKHRANIQRLLNGTESRFGRRGDAAPSRR
jgi:glycerol-3-phosphate acyltransferase PlsY